MLLRRSRAFPSSAADRVRYAGSPIRSFSPSRWSCLAGDDLGDRVPSGGAPSSGSRFQHSPLSGRLPGRQHAHHAVDDRVGLRHRWRVRAGVGCPHQLHPTGSASDLSDPGGFIRRSQGCLHSALHPLVGRRASVQVVGHFAIGLFSRDREHDYRVARRGSRNGGADPITAG